MNSRKIERLKQQKRRPSTPGDVLREVTLPELAMSQGELAQRLGVSRRTVNEILCNKRPVSADMAHRIGRLLGNGPQLWLNMQASVDMWDALHMDARQYENIQPLETRAA